MNSKRNGNNDAHSRFNQLGDPCYINEDANGSSYTMQFEYAFDEENPSSDTVDVTEYTYNSADPDCPDWFSLLHFDANEMTSAAEEEDQSHREMTPLPPDTKFRGRYTWTDREIDDDTDLQYNRVGGHIDPSVGRFLEEDETDDDDDYGNDPPADSEGE